MSNTTTTSAVGPAEPVLGINGLRRNLIILPLASCLSQRAAGNATMSVVYPAPNFKGDQHDAFAVDLLTLTLQRSGRAYRVAPHRNPMTQKRLLIELEDGRELDVIWTMTTKERERSLLPVRIPVDLGLGGWRLLLVRESMLPRFVGMQSLAGLRHLRAGQGAGWPDVDILRAAGLDVETASSYDSLFRMLASGHIDYFPRGALEIWPELDTHPGMGLAAEPSLVMRYPTASYFFVNKARPELAADIARGFEVALKDGSYAALFQRYLGRSLRRAQLGQRRLIEIGNPLLPPATPLKVVRYWYRP